MVSASVAFLAHAINISSRHDSSQILELALAYLEGRANTASLPTWLLYMLAVLDAGKAGDDTVTCWR